MSSLKIFIYTRSAGPAQLILPLIELMQGDGNKLVCWTDGPAVQRFSDAGVDLYFTGPTTTVPYALSEECAYDVISSVKPDVVVLAPNGGYHGVDLSLAQAARKLSIPFVWLEDYWGNQSRAGFPPNGLLVLDDFAADLAERRHPKLHIEVMGNHGAVEVEVSSQTRKFMERLRSKFSTIYTFLGGGGETTTSELQLLCQSLQKTPGNWCLIPGFHPAIASQEAVGGGTWADVWNRIIEEPLAGRIIEKPDLPTAEIVVTSDLVFGGFPTDFSKAIVAGVPVVSLWTEKTAKALSESTPGAGLDQNPHVALGLAQMVTEPCDLGGLFAWLPDDSLVSSKLKAYDPSIPYRMVREMA